MGNSKSKPRAVVGAVAKQLTLTSLIPEAVPKPEHFSVEEITLDKGCENDGDIVLQLLVISADPYMRGGFKSGAVPRPVAGFVAGKVVESRNARWPVGALLGAHLPYQTLQVVTAEQLRETTMIWDLTPYVEEKDISLGIGVLGMPGSTAYGGFIDVLRPNSGETLFVSAAAGAVGSLVGQIAKHVYACRVIGSAGGEAKGALVKEKFGFDEAIDYKTANDAAELTAQLKEKAPDGIDMYFENVGGIHFDAAFASLRPKGRIAVCGAISGYNEAIQPKNEIAITSMIYSQQRIEGFVCRPWLTGERGQFLKDMSKWLKEGKVKSEETFFDGIAAFPQAFEALFTGANTGKVVVRTGGDVAFPAESE